MSDDAKTTSFTAALLELRADASEKATLEPTELCERAAKFTGLADFGTDFMPALEALCSCYEREERLAPGGRVTVGWHIIQALTTRLRLTDRQKRVPEIFGKPLNDPIIVVGLPRSGTTYLHQLLCALPDTRFLTFWEAREPIADETTDDRRQRFALVAELIRRGAPDLEFKHPIELDGPEECMYLLDPSFVSQSFISADAPCPAYFEWLMQADQREPYRIYRLLLEYIQASAPEKRLILKSPTHLSALEALLRAVPEAKIVHTHRDPLSVLPSMCSLLETLYRPAVTHLDRKRLGRDMLLVVAEMLDRALAARVRLPEEAICDIDFAALTSDPETTVRSVFDHFGLGWSADADRALSAELARGRPKQVGRHRYSLEQYGLDATQVRERFATYRRRLAFD